MVSQSQRDGLLTLLPVSMKQLQLINCIICLFDFTSLAVLVRGTGVVEVENDGAAVGDFRSSAQISEEYLVICSVDRHKAVGGNRRVAIGAEVSSEMDGKRIFI